MEVVSDKVVEIGVDVEMGPLSPSHASSLGSTTSMSTPVQPTTLIPTATVPEATGPVTEGIKSSGSNSTTTGASISDGVRCHSSPSLRSLVTSSCTYNNKNSPRISPATSTTGILLMKAAIGNRDNRNKMLENERQIAILEASVSKNRVTWSLIIMFSFLIITMIITVICSYIYDTPESVAPRQYETTASFRYDGHDVVQEGLFKLTHGRHEVHGKLPEPGCVAFYDKDRSIGQRDNKEFCLIDNERVQTLRFKPSDLNIRRDVAISTGPDSFVTLYQEGRATLNLFNVLEKDLWSHTFDEISISYIREHIYSDNSQIMVEVEGSLAVPAACVLFSSKAASAKDMKSLMMCGRSGVDTIIMNKKSFAQIGVDMEKLGSDFPFVTTGELTAVDLYTENNFKGPVLSLRTDDKTDLTKKEFVSLASNTNSHGVVTKWSSGLSAMKVSIISNIGTL